MYEHVCICMHLNINIYRHITYFMNKIYVNIYIYVCIYLYIYILYIYIYIYACKRLQSNSRLHKADLMYITKFQLPVHN